MLPELQLWNMRISIQLNHASWNVQRSSEKYRTRFADYVSMMHEASPASIYYLLLMNALYIHIYKESVTLLTMILQARRIIAMLSQDFIVDGCTILVHGFSRVVLEVLKAAAESRKLFRVFCTGLC